MESEWEHVKPQGGYNVVSQENEMEHVKPVSDSKTEEEACKFIVSPMSQLPISNLCVRGTYDSIVPIAVAPLWKWSAPKTPSCIVVDDVYSNPDAIRQFALKQDFGIRRNFPGARTCSFATEEQKHMFEHILGRKITWRQERDAYNGCFQVCVSRDRSWIHRDLEQYSAILYLTPNAPLAAGTIFYRHRESGRTKAKDANEERDWQAIAYDESKWEVTDTVANKYNRLVLFNGHQTHRSATYFGDSLETGRLFQMFFFDVEP